MVGRGYALSQLLESRAPKERTELRLPEQKALHRRCFVDHDVGQHAQLFESFEGQVLRLIDNQQHASAIALLHPHEVGYLTSLAVNGLPSCHLTPGRNDRVRRYCRTRRITPSLEK